MLEKVECVDANWRIVPVLAILNYKICTKIDSFCSYVALYLKVLFGNGILIFVGRAIIIITKL